MSTTMEEIAEGTSVADRVLIERHGRTSLITLNRPEVRNAVDLAMSIALGDALEQADQDPDVSVIVLTGAGPAFCAGADLKAIARGEMVRPTDEKHAPWGFAGITSHLLSKPTIAAVNGYAVGGGTEIVLATDLAVASETALFGLPEVRRGLIAAAGGAFRLPEQIPRKVAMEMLLTGEPITAARAAELGLVNRVVSPGEVVPAALELADRIGHNAPLAVQASRAIALGVGDDGATAEEPYWRVSRAKQRTMLESADAAEGMAAFAEKRDPVWRGR
jgi:crotonobetainyl-CoA hydratase